MNCHSLASQECVWFSLSLDLPTEAIYLVDDTWALPSVGSSYFIFSNPNHRLPPPFSVFTATREDISLLLHTFYKLDSRFTPQPCPILPNTPWFIIPMIYDVSECRECCRQTRYSFVHVPTADKVKVNVDALDDFIQNLLMCLLCTINLKPLGVSKQSVATAALL